jgi:hypothetical protein
MRPPFTAEQFFEVFRLYNEAVWPLQIVFHALALAALALVFARGGSGRPVSAILAALWAWMGLAYHLVYFREINPAATLFGLLFLAGAAAFAWSGAVRARLHFVPQGGVAGAVGAALVAYALVLYPLAAVLLGHGYPAMPTFGLPCPTTLFTLGMLAFLKPPRPVAVFVVPLLWTLVGAQAALAFGVLEDFGLLVAGIAGLWLVFQGRMKSDERSLVS